MGRLLAKKGNYFIGFWVLCVLGLPVTCSGGENARFEAPSPGPVSGVRAALRDASEEARRYLAHLVGARALDSAEKSVHQVLGVVAEGVASGLNVMSEILTQLLGATGMDVASPLTRVAPEDVLYIGQWVLLALIGYWLLSLAFRLVATAARRFLWLVKVGVAAGLFGLILSDRAAAAETTALRLAGLVGLCVLLGVGSSNRASSVVDKAARLEELVSVLEKRVRELERRRREE